MLSVREDHRFYARTFPANNSALLDSPGFPRVLKS